ncbi:MAG TPA: hypothetical protein VFZ70_15740 [Euzebyales bacterium]
MTGLDARRRRELRHALVQRHPWIDDVEVGPRAVEAGECDRCGAEARLVTTCGPIRWAELGRRCAAEVGTDAWCDGHAGEAADLLRRLRDLPDEADTVARLWWVATGEVRLDAAAVTPMVAAALPSRAGLDPP